MEVTNLRHVLYKNRALFYDYLGDMIHAAPVNKHEAVKIAKKAFVEVTHGLEFGHDLTRYDRRLPAKDQIHLAYGFAVKDALREAGFKGAEAEKMYGFANTMFLDFLNSPQATYAYALRGGLASPSSPRRGVSPRRSSPRRDQPRGPDGRYVSAASSSRRSASPSRRALSPRRPASPSSWLDEYV